MPRSPQKLPFTSEAESEASMSEASSEDLVPPLEADEAPDRDEEEAAKKKKKKSKGLANMFSVFTKGRKKKSQPSSAETEGDSESKSGPVGRLPTGRQGPQVPAGQGLGRIGAHWSGRPTHPGQRGQGRWARRCLPCQLPLRALISGAGSERRGPRSCLGRRLAPSGASPHLLRSRPTGGDWWVSGPRAALTSGPGRSGGAQG